MQEAVRQGPLFALAPDDQVACVLAAGKEVTLQPGDALFKEGDVADHFSILLEGEIQVTKLVSGQEIVLVTHSLPGSFTGEIPLLTGTPYVATARALRVSRVLQIRADRFRQILSTCPAVLHVILSALAERLHSMELVTMQQEKLAALGKLSAGLAHELNNPAAAAQRASEQMRDTLLALQDRTYALYGQSPQTKLLFEWQRLALQRTTMVSPLDALARSDQEEEVANWLEAHGVADNWELAATFVEMGLDTAWFDALAHSVEESALANLLPLLEKMLTMFSLIHTVEQSTARISTLVKAVKAYSYMDQAPLQEVDIHEGLENTLTILGHKLKNVMVVRNYDRTLPHVPVYGSELNQVWTNLIDNAIDALEGHGQLTIRTSRADEYVVVEIVDNGPGIPEEIRSRIFEPFFTTKGVGQGSGLGLDMAYRIVVRRHHGDLQVVSHPGETRFIVRLPISIREGE